jgi:hypothetical protein
MKIGNEKQSPNLLDCLLRAGISVPAPDVHNEGSSCVDFLYFL